MRYVKTLIILTIIIVLTAGIARMFWCDGFNNSELKIDGELLVFLNSADYTRMATQIGRGNADGTRRSMVIDGKEVELKLDFKAGEDPYFVLALPPGRGLYADSDADLTRNMENQKTTSEEMAFSGGGEQRSRTPSAERITLVSIEDASDALYSPFRRQFNYNIENNYLQNKNILTKSEDVFIGPLRTEVPSIDTYLQYSILKNFVKGLFLNNVFAAEVKPPLLPFGKGGNMDSVKVKLTNPAGEEVEVGADTRLIASDGNDGKDLLEIRVGRDASAFKPGVWNMSVEIETKKNILRAQQDFSWGVLAINRDKDVYVVRGDLPLSQRGIKGDFSEDGAGNENLTNGASSALGKIPPIRLSLRAGPNPPLEKGGTSVYTEQRIWQIASDSIYKNYIRNDATRTYIQAQSKFKTNSNVK